MVESEVQLYLLAQNLIERCSVSYATVIDVRSLVALINNGELHFCVLQRIQLQRSFGTLRTRSHSAAERVKESSRSIDVARFKVAVEERQRLRNRQLIGIAVVTCVAVNRKDVAATDDLAVAASPGHLQQTVTRQGLLNIKAAEQEVAAFSFALQDGGETEFQSHTLEVLLRARRVNG